MKSTSRLLSILILIVTPFLAACSQTVDIYFQQDESWQVKSRLNFSAQEMLLFRGVIQDFLVQITQEAIPSQMLQVDDWPGPAFDLLKAYYAKEGIEFRWQKLFNSYTMEAEGRSLDQFEGLLPGAIETEKLEDDQYHLYINLGEFNMFAAMVYKQTITLHGGEIINSNAPKQTSNTAVWNNPGEIDATFETGSQISFTWLIVLIAILIVISAIVFAINIRSSQLGKARITN
jgi:hypothetical protein